MRKDAIFDMMIILRWVTNISFRSRQLNTRLSYLPIALFGVNTTFSITRSGCWAAIMRSLLPCPRRPLKSYVSIHTQDIWRRVRYWQARHSCDLVRQGTLQWRHTGRDSVSKSPASRLFTQPFIQTQIKENVKAPRHWPLCGEFTGDRWIPRTNGQ